MDTLNEYIRAYYEACYELDDGAHKDALLERVEEVVIALLLFYGSSTLSELTIILDGIPAEVAYQPNEETISRGADDLRDTLNGLYERISVLLIAYGTKFPNMSVDEVRNNVRLDNYWQADRIVDATDHILANLAELQIVASIIKQQDVTVTKTWRAVIDAKTCAVCLAMDGQTVPFDRPFTFNGSEVSLDSHYSDFANAHPHCRCQIQYNTEGR